MNFQLPVEAVLTAIKDHAPDTRTFSLRLQDDEQKLDFRPGQFNMLGLPGFGEAPFTFSSPPQADGSFEHTVRAVGRLTKGLFKLRVGDVLHIRGPFGSAWPLHEVKGKDLLVVAGGMGMVPLRPFLLEVFLRRADYGRIVVLFGARTPAELIYQEEFHSWRSQPDTTLLLTVDEVPPRVEWDGHTGVVTGLFPEMDIDPNNAAVLTCGPEIMMRFVARGLLLRRFSPGTTYLSLERRMKCGTGHCGHCQLGPKFVCKDGPVFRYIELSGLPDTLL
ncbi:MAG: FAD/NAD(P)-binding protein [Acidobacteriota bacterium]